MLTLSIVLYPAVKEREIRAGLLFATNCVNLKE